MASTPNPADSWYQSVKVYTDKAKVTMASALSVTPSSPPRAGTVEECLTAIDFRTKFSCLCPSCTNTSWDHVLLQDDPPVSCADDVAGIQTQCLICVSKMPLWKFLPHDQVKRLYQEVKNWMWGSVVPAGTQIPTTVDPNAIDPGTWLRGAVAYTPTHCGKEYPFTDFDDTPRRVGCEADKPIGTRDPDKFLKEQQNKLWAEMMK